MLTLRSQAWWSQTWRSLSTRRYQEETWMLRPESAAMRASSIVKFGKKRTVLELDSNRRDLRWADEPSECITHLAIYTTLLNSLNLRSCNRAFQAIAERVQPRKEIECLLKQWKRSKCRVSRAREDRRSCQMKVLWAGGALLRRLGIITHSSQERLRLKTK